MGGKGIMIVSVFIVISSALIHREGHRVWKNIEASREQVGWSQVGENRLLSTTYLMYTNLYDS